MQNDSNYDTRQTGYLSETKKMRTYVAGRVGELPDEVQTYQCYRLLCKMQTPLHVPGERTQMLIPEGHVRSYNNSILTIKTKKK